MAKKAKWVKIDDSRLRHVWTCGEKGCKGKAVVYPGWYADNGTPVCPECDRDLCYDRTEALGFQGWLGTYTPDTDAGKVGSDNRIAAYKKIKKALKELADICEYEDKFPIHTERARKALNGEELGEE